MANRPSSNNLRRLRPQQQICGYCRCVSNSPLLPSKFSKVIKLCTPCYNRESVQGRLGYEIMGLRHCSYCYGVDPRGEYFLSQQSNKLCYECYAFEVAFGKLVPKSERRVKPPKSKFRGVFWLETIKCWQARIFVNYAPQDCGTYIDEKEAGIATNWYCGEHGIPVYNPQLLARPSRSTIPNPY